MEIRETMDTRKEAEEVAWVMELEKLGSWGR